MPKTLIATLIAAAFAITGCGPDKSGGSYSDVEDLRDAYVSAGGTCDDWEQNNEVGGAAQSGACGMSTVLSTYLTREAVQDRIAETKDGIGSLMGGEWLTGENWIINSDNVRELQKQLGGQIVSFGDDEQEK